MRRALLLMACLLVATAAAPFSAHAARTETRSYDASSAPACFTGSNVLVNGNCLYRTNGMNLGGVRFDPDPGVPKRIDVADDVARGKVWMLACQDSNNNAACEPSEPRATSCGTGTIDLTGQGFLGSLPTYVYVNLLKLGTADPLEHSGCAGAIRGEVSMTWN